MPPQQQPMVRRQYQTNYEEDIESRMASLEILVNTLLSLVPTGLAQEVSDLRARVTAIEQQEDPMEPVIPNLPIEYGPTVPIRGVSKTISGARERYIWIDKTNETAEYRSYTQEPMPDGWEIVDTNYLPLAIPRSG